MNEYEQNIEIMKDLRAKLDKVLQDQPENKLNIQPKDTSKGHFYVSLVKSFLRISAGVCLVLIGVEPELTVTWLRTTGGLLIAAEILGIIEELV